MYPWYDHSGRLSPLKLMVFIALFVPAGWVAFAYVADLLGPRAYNEATHQTGLWTIRLIFIALAITPVRHILQWPRLILVRRMIGVAAFAYAFLHFGLYVVDQAFDMVKVASEIVRRIYLTIGFAALIGLAALAATSTDSMIKRMGGRNWQRLHRLVYLIGVLAVVHYSFQSKLDQWEPAIMAGLLAWLLAYRLLVRLVGARGKLPLPWVAGLSVAAGIATAFGEAFYFHLAFGVGMTRVLDANLSLATGVRPAVVVLAIAVTVTAAGALRTQFPGSAKRKMRYA